MVEGWCSTEARQRGALGVADYSNDAGESLLE